MIEPNIYCKVSGMAMQCIADFYRENQKRPVVVEIGCADGKGTMRFAGFCDRVVCVDPMVNARPDISPSEERSKIVSDEKKISDFTRRTQDFHVDLVIGCSQWPDVVEHVQRLLVPFEGKCDILVIDGAHHPFEAVWADFQSYYPVVRPGGFVIFDDLYEECIMQAYQRAIDDYGMVVHDRWWVKEPYALQDVGALRKKKV